MHFKVKKVPLSPNFAQRGNLPLKFGNFLKIAKKIITHYQNSNPDYECVMERKGRPIPLGHPPIVATPVLSIIYISWLIPYDFLSK